MPYSSRLAYCDTDSLICENLALPENAHELGGWALEAWGNQLSVAGKKMYALTNDGQPIDEKGKKEKIASKGIKATTTQIEMLCRGENFVYDKPAPAFSLTRGVSYISREVTFTARIEK
jgi:hypothetical protein